MPKKEKPLPPGIYTIQIERVRKVRNKDQKRIHMSVVDGPHTGTKFTDTLNPEEDDAAG